MQGLLIERVLDLYLRSRRSGTTSLVEKISQNEDCYVISVVNDIKVPVDRLLNIRRMSTTKGMSLHKPLLIDNHAIIELCRDAKDLSDKLQCIIKEKDLLLFTKEQELGRTKSDTYYLNYIRSSMWYRVSRFLRLIK